MSEPAKSHIGTTPAVSDAGEPARPISEPGASDSEPVHLLAHWTAADIRAQLEFILSRRVRSSIYRGAIDARRRDERYAIAHLFHALLHDRDACDALTALGADIGALRAHLDDQRAQGYPGPWLEGEFTQALHSVLFEFYQHALYSRSSSIDSAHLLVSIVTSATDDGSITSLLSESGISALGLKEYAAHGARQKSRLSRWWQRMFGPRVPGLVGVGVDVDNPLVPLGARMEIEPIPDLEVHVVLHNDPYTSKRFVTDMLREHFGMDAHRATELTEHTHLIGWAYLGPLTHKVATMRICDVHEQARAEGFPLRLSIHRKRPR